MIAELGANVPSKSFVIARNWDRLGGRLTEILNGLYISAKFDLPFRFIWPKEERFSEIEHQKRIFSSDFLERYLLDVSTLDGTPELSLFLDGSLSEQEFKTIVYESSQVYAIRFPNFMKVPVFPGESEETNLSMYPQLSDCIWSPEILQYSELIKSHYQNVCVLHCRFGDLINGSWRNWVDPKKHITAVQIEALLNENRLRGLETQIISDSKELFRVFPNLSHPPVGEFLTIGGLDIVSSETVTDLLKMKSSREVVGPEASAFSTLGAWLGGKKVQTLIRHRLNIWEAIETVTKTKDLWARSESPEIGPFISRDIDQHVNSLTGIYDLELFSQITEEAILADPTNVHSMCNRAIYLSLVGDSSESQTLLLEAKEFSREALRTHHDPLFFTLTAECLVEIILEFARLSRGVRDFGLELRLSEIIKEMGLLHPYQIDKNRVLGSLKRIREGYISRHKNDIESSSPFYVGLLFELTRSRFGGLSEGVFMFNFLQSVLTLVFPDALTQERDALTQERDALTQERDALTQERDALTQERDALTQERDAILQTKTWRWAQPARLFLSWFFQWSRKSETS